MNNSVKKVTTWRFVNVFEKQGIFLSRQLKAEQFPPSFRLCSDLFRIRIQQGIITYLKIKVGV